MSDCYCKKNKIKCCCSQYNFPDPCIKIKCDPCKKIKECCFNKCDPCIKIKCDPCIKIKCDPCHKIKCDPCYKIKECCFDKCDPCYKNKCDPCYKINKCYSDKCDPCVKIICDPCRKNNSCQPKVKKFATELTGRQEVPPNCSNAFGKFIGCLCLSGNQATLRYTINTIGLVPCITEAHFHLAPPGLNGDVVKTIPINKCTGNVSGVWSSTDCEPLTPELVQALKKGCIYVNIHTFQFPGGEIRGQVEKIC